MLAQGGEKPVGGERMATEVEERVVGVHVVDAEELGVQVGHACLGDTPRSPLDARSDRSCRGKRRRVDLAGSGARQRCQRGKRAGHHDLRQLVGGKPAYGRYIERIGIRRDQIGVHGVVAIRSGRRAHQAVVDVGMPEQGGSHLAQLDPVPPDLHLIVGTADEFQNAGPVASHQITRTVESPADTERVGDEVGGRHRRTIEIASRELLSAEIQLPDETVRDHLEPIVEDMGVDIGVRPADGFDRMAGRRHHRMVGGRDHGLGGAVVVAQFHIQGAQRAVGDLTG